MYLPVVISLSPTQRVVGVALAAAQHVYAVRRLRHQVSCQTNNNKFSTKDIKQNELNKFWLTNFVNEIESGRQDQRGQIEQKEFWSRSFHFLWLAESRIVSIDSTPVFGRSVLHVM